MDATALPSYHLMLSPEKPISTTMLQTGCSTTIHPIIANSVEEQQGHDVLKKANETQIHHPLTQPSLMKVRKEKLFVFRPGDLDYSDED